MKSKDIALIGVMAFIGIVLALLVSHLVFGSPSSRQQTAEAVDPISSSFKTPPDTYFNANSTNPAPEIKVGDANNSNPFSAQSQ